MIVLAYNAHRELGFINWKGIAWLTFWAIALGPCFTVLTLTYLLVERFD